jgi:hypothetical protein
MAREYAFRFCFVYFTLWSAATQVLGGVTMTPFGTLPALGPLWPMHGITEWIGMHVLGVAATFEPGNSGDTLFYWIQTFWILCVASIVAAIWVRLKPDTTDDTTDDPTTVVSAFRRTFTLFLRFALAAQMFYFGLAKVIPTQFVPPALTTLVQPIGNAPLSTLLWIFMGASLPYQIFTGLAEVLAGLLLIWPRTATIGALIALVDMIQVFALNMAYDVGLKQISFHFIVMALLLVVWRPDARRWRAQIVFGLYLLAMFTLLQVRQWNAPEGPAHPRSALYGIWDIEELAVDGDLHPAMLNDYDRRWRRAIFDFPDRMAFQRTDDSFARYGVVIDAQQHTLQLTRGGSQTWRALFDYERASENELRMEGTMDGHAIRMRLSLVGLDTFPLLNSSFRWIRPPD